MRPTKDSTVRKVVVSLLVAVVILIPLSIAFNRLSLSTEGFNVAEVFSRGRAASQPTSAAAPPRVDSDFTDLVNEEFLEVADPSLTLQDGTDSRNANSMAPALSTGNQTETLQVCGDPSPRAPSSPRAASPRVASSPRAPSSPVVVVAPSSPVVVVVPSSPPTSDNAANVDKVLESSSSSSTDYTPSWNRSQATRQRVFQPASLPHYSFVKFSAYRQSLRTFLVTGITSYVARTFDRGRIVHTCEWHSLLNETIAKTTPDHIYWKSDENGGTYSPTTINCSFRSEVGADGKGGLLVLRISTGYDRWERNLPVVAMEERPGEFEVVLTPPEKLPFKYAFCGAPMHGAVRADWVLDWMTHHHFLANGSAHFFFYNLGGLKEADRQTFQRFTEAGKLSVTDILDPNLVADYPTWYYHQVLLINDCLHRSRFVAQRVFFIDYDEFVQIPAPDTLSEFMARHEKEPWVSLGSMYANTKDCRSTEPGEVKAPLERMLWRRPVPECRVQPPATTIPDPWLCIGPLGRRKFVANPRETFAAGVHWVTVPETGLNLPANEAHILHYRSAPIPKLRLCANNITQDSEEQAILDDGWIRDESTSKTYSEAKSFPI